MAAVAAADTRTAQAPDITAALATPATDTTAMVTTATATAVADTAVGTVGAVCISADPGGDGRATIPTMRPTPIPTTPGTRSPPPARRSSSKTLLLRG